MYNFEEFQSGSTGGKPQYDGIHVGRSNLIISTALMGRVGDRRHASIATDRKNAAIRIAFSGKKNGRSRKIGQYPASGRCGCLSHCRLPMPTGRYLVKTEEETDDGLVVILKKEK